MSRHTHLVIAFAVVALTFSAAAPALGHAAITDSVPSDRSTVSEITEVSVTANEKLLDIGENSEGFVLAVSDEDGHFYGDGCVSVRGDTASMPVVLTTAGEYRVGYRVVSNDGHPIEGSFSFRFDGTDSAEPAPAFAERPRCGVPQEAIPATAPAPEGFVPVDELPTAEPATPSNDFDLTPWIGLVTIPLVLGGVWLLMRSLGRHDSEDHLD
jgi:methionine-rich copper-binding protein CopC